MIGEAYQTMIENSGMEDVDGIIQSYVMTLEPKDRINAGWTLNEIFHTEAVRLGDYVHSKDPSWNWGKPVDPSILEGYQRGIDIKATPHNSRQAHLLAYYFVRFYKFRRQRTLLLPTQFVVSDEKSDNASVPPELCGIALRLKLPAAVCETKNQIRRQENVWSKNDQQYSYLCQDSTDEITVTAEAGLRRYYCQAGCVHAFSCQRRNTEHCGSAYC